MIEHQLSIRFELGQVKVQRRNVGNEIVAGLLERHEHARLAKLGDAADQELHRQQRLAGTGRAANQRRASARQPALRHLIEPCDPGRCLGERC